MKHCINEYGIKLHEDFISKTTMREDINNGTFSGTMFYEDDIKTFEDAIGWMIETYYYYADDIIDEWIDYDKRNNNDNMAWGFDMNNIKQELEKCFDY